MNIAIIGAGNVGKALASTSVKAGHKVTIAASSADHAAEAAKATGAKAARSSVEAVKDAELVILAVPSSKLDDAIGQLGSALDGKVVIDTTNRVNRQDPGQVLDGTSLTERIQKRVPKAHVVKAFNYAFHERQVDPMVDGLKLDGFVAGDDPAAKDKTLEFVRSIGFRPIDAGPLVMARVLEGMALLIILLQIQNNWPRQNGWKLVGPPYE
jgi:predicted dinucleotide-binding enzyme